jgi:hypothetical protein
MRATGPGTEAGFRQSRGLTECLDMYAAGLWLLAWTDAVA